MLCSGESWCVRVRGTRERRREADETFEIVNENFFSHNTRQYISPIGRHIRD